MARHEETGQTDLDSSIDLLSGGVKKLLEQNKILESDVKALGIGIPALIDDKGYLVFAPNLGWRDIAIGQRLEQTFTGPVYLDNDTKAAALAEKLFGRAQASQNFIFISGHSGVGGGLYLADSLYRGSSGLAGEIGHMTVNPEGPICNCGNQGCLEMYVSEAAILAHLRKQGLVLKNVWDIKRQADQADETILGVLHISAYYLGIALANLVNMLNPKKIIIGGNLAIIAPVMMPLVKQELVKRALKKPLDDCEISLSLFGAESVPMGGIALALEGFLALPNWLTRPN
jgi:predicted NBD/HSP70 family sugar kinase